MVCLMCFAHSALPEHNINRNLRKPASIFGPVGLSSLLSSASANPLNILAASVRPNGSPVLQLSNGTAHSYDAILSTFVKLSDKWWMEGSDAWQGRPRGRAGVMPTSVGVVAGVEQAIAELARADAADDAARERPEWWGAALTLGHLETKIHAARVLDSPQEYKHALLQYAQRLANEGFRSKAEELVKELFGPVYW
jgi:protein HIRA/HIR1